MTEFLDRVAGQASYRLFDSPRELARLVRDDLATLMSERFTAARSTTPTTAPAETTVAASAVAPESAVPEAAVPESALPESRRRRPRPLPVGTTSLIDRSGAIDDVVALLSEPNARLVTLTGPGGIGKTRVAAAVAERLSDEFGSVAFVPLASVTSAELVLDAMGRSMRLDMAGTGSPLDALVEALADRRLLLVLDNLEQVVGVAADLSTLLAQCPGLAIIATSRTVLSLRAEQEYSVPHQYHHAVDIVPTILDVLGVEPPDAIKGHTQSPFDGVSMRYSFDDSSAATTRRTQFYSMLGSHGIWHDGWKAVTTHMVLAGWSHFGQDTWELYHTDTDRSECHDLAESEPERLNDMINLWYAEAGANGAFPLDDRGAVEILTTPRPVLTPPRDRYVYYPDAAEVPEAQAVNIRNRSYSIGAFVDIPTPDAEGVLFAHGARFGGHAMYIKNNRLHYVYSFVGSIEQKIVANADVPTGDGLILSASFDKEREESPGVATGILSLYYGERKVGEGRIKTQPGKFSIAGEGLCVGRDSGEPVTDDYPGQRPWRFTGGTTRRVVVDVSGDPYLDLEREAAAMLARE